MDNKSLEELATNRKIKIHEPFAEFLKANHELHSFEISLLDCYRLAGHACHATTSTFLMLEAAIDQLYSETKTCERGDLQVEFGTALEEMATGPRSHIVSYITGAWDQSGFPGLKGKHFVRKNLLSFGVTGVPKSGIRLTRLSTGQSVTVTYHSDALLDRLQTDAQFPDVWREELVMILENSAETLSLSN